METQLVIKQQSLSGDDVLSVTIILSMEMVQKYRQTVTNYYESLKVLTDYINDR